MTGTRDYFRPLVQYGPVRPADAVRLAGGWCWFTHVELLARGRPGRVIRAGELPDTARAALSAERARVLGMSMDRPRLMAILNVTPDSFSDGGVYAGTARALHGAREMAGQGADIIDVGGESTRPGAQPVEETTEIARVVGPVAAIREELGTPVSIDTRKANVARAAIDAGARLVNDVAGFTYDEALAPLCASLDVPVCVMHAQGDPQTMQDNPSYDDVVLDVYDFLAERVTYLEAQGISRDRIVVDPGIGFGKTLDHNLALLRNLSVFHGLGCAVLLGASRKGFIRAIGHAEKAQDRMAGSVAVGLAAVAQGVQILRVHDVWETKQALRLWRAVAGGEHDGS